ncbi:MAG: Sua5/YciO/YrdC/YwlC family protein [Thiomicrospira sp.]|jgi:L-threonylcarbamoyladenylate synthase|nr:Sua5/YciO/YrdC/YwlC family protein [Thiomicrospira sp.]
MNISLQQAQQRLAQGEVIAYPTEAVFGLGCDPFNLSAVTRLLALKQRPLEKGLILVAAQAQAFADLTCLYQQAWSDKVLASWQDPAQAITWLLPKTVACPDWISGQHATVAVRVSHHPQVRALCGEGVLVSTSANPASAEPARDCHQVAAYFGQALPCLAAPLGGLAQPSQIWDAQSGTRLR